MSGKWSSRIVAGVFALGATAIVFWLWATFGATLHQAMSVQWADPNAPQKSDDGVYTVNVLPPPSKPCSPNPDGKPCKPK